MNNHDEEGSIWGIIIILVLGGMAIMGMQDILWTGGM